MKGFQVDVLQLSQQAKFGKRKNFYSPRQRRQMSWYFTHSNSTISAIKTGIKVSFMIWLPLMHSGFKKMIEVSRSRNIVKINGTVLVSFGYPSVISFQVIFHNFPIKCNNSRLITRNNVSAMAVSGIISKPSQKAIGKGLGIDGILGRLIGTWNLGSSSTFWCLWRLNSAAKERKSRNEGGRGQGITKWTG